jgi:hypothetical protein
MIRSDADTQGTVGPASPSLAVFFRATFGIARGSIAVLIGFPDALEPLFGPPSGVVAELSP